MSWDIIAMDLPPNADVAELPDDFEPNSLGTRAEVIAQITRVLPDADFSDPSWGVLDGEGYAVEINLGRDSEAVMHVGLRLTGGEGGLHVVARLLEQLSWRAFDVQTGDVYEPETARASFDTWSSWRDQVIGGSPSS